MSTYMAKARSLELLAAHHFLLQHAQSSFSIYFSLAAIYICLAFVSYLLISTPQAAWYEWRKHRNVHIYYIWAFMEILCICKGACNVQCTHIYKTLKHTQIIGGCAIKIQIKLHFSLFVSFYGYMLRWLCKVRGDIEVCRLNFPPTWQLRHSITTICGKHTYLHTCLHAFVI